MEASYAVGCEMNDLPGGRVPEDVLMDRCLTELNAQENWVKGMHKLVERVLCVLKVQLLFFAHVQVVHSFFGSRAA